MLDDATIKYLDNLDNLTLVNDISKLYTNLGEEATDLTADHVEELTNDVDGVKQMLTALKATYDAYKTVQGKLAQSQDTNVKLMYQLSQKGLEPAPDSKEAEEKAATENDAAIDKALEDINDEED